MADDATWWVPGRGQIDRATFLGLANTFRGVLAGPFTMTILAVTAEDDRVAVETEGFAPMTDGRTYANSYHFLFRIQGGKIVEMREHNNSLVPHMMFGDKMPPLKDMPESV
jgi:ketosteroid isomerase-like protein